MSRDGEKEVSRGAGGLERRPDAVIIGVKALVRST